MQQGLRGSGRWRQLRARLPGPVLKQCRKAVHRNVRVGVHAGEAALSNRIAFVVPPQDSVLGICTSSATVGPSISLGIADAVTIFSRDVALADAWATAVCNEIRPDNVSVLDRINPNDVRGIFAIMGDQHVRWGKLPSIVSADVDERLISAGDR
jgi:ApbE superfamily uncharacterized protein (UPF0280 family)